MAPGGKNGKVCEVIKKMGFNCSFFTLQDIGDPECPLTFSINIKCMLTIRRMNLTLETLLRNTELQSTRAKVIYHKKI